MALLVASRMTNPKILRRTIFIVHVAQTGRISPEGTTEISWLAHYQPPFSPPPPRWRSEPASENHRIGMPYGYPPRQRQGRRNPRIELRRPSRAEINLFMWVPVVLLRFTIG